MNHKFITIEGNIGAGKTTLASMLAKELSAHLILEQFADNPFLPMFYKEPDRYAFPLELFFMAERYQQLQETIQGDLFNEVIVSDYLFMKSLLFAKNTLTETELNLYMRLFSIIHSRLPQPDIILYLHSPVSRLMENIAKRGRDYEAQITEEYLKSIEERYFQYFKSIQDERSIVILDTRSLDFVHNGIDYQKIKEVLSKNYEKGIHRL